MKKKDPSVELIKTHTILPLYIRKAKIETIENDSENSEIDHYFPLFSNKDAYQTKRHNRHCLHKPILLLNEDI